MSSGPPAIHRLTALRQWAVQLLQCTVPMPGGSGQWTSRNTLPDCAEAVGSGPPAIHCLTARGQCAVDLLQYIAPLPWGSGQWTSCDTVPVCLRVVGSGPPALQSSNAWGQRAVAFVIHCLTATGQWAADLLQYTASLPGGSGQLTPCNTLPHCLGAAGSGPCAPPCPAAWGQWAVELLQYTASLPQGSGQWTSCNGLPHYPGCGGQWTSCNTLPHQPGAVGSDSPAINCLTVSGQSAVDLLQYTLHCASPQSPGCWGNPAIHCLTARGQWAVDLPQHTASLPRGSGQWTSRGVA